MSVFPLPCSLPTTLEEARKELEEAHREIETLGAQIQDCEAQLQDREALIKVLQHNISILQKYLFGQRSEKRPPEEENNNAQLSIFDAPEEATEEESAEEVCVPAHTRKKGGRKPLPADLPRDDDVLDVPEEEKVCSCGCQKHRMGEDVTEELEIVPQRVFVRRIIRPKYVCRRCSGSIVQKPLPERPIKRCLAGPGFLAYMIVSKYADHIPLCRLERILGRSGVDITRSNMSEWAMRLHQLCQPLVKHMKRRLLESAVINSDDTLIRVQAKNQTRRCYLWAYLGDENSPYTVYDFRDSRSRAGPNAMLADYAGYLQADAYTGYEDLYKLIGEDGQPRIREVGCWAHARRYFVEAEDFGDRLAEKAVELIRKLYRIEKQAREECKGKPLEELYARRFELRQEHSKPILKQLFEWMKDRFEVLPQSPLSKALNYAQNNRAALERYTGDGRLAIDNNAAERALRPVTVGRKNWLFAGSDQGGHAAATFFTLIESAKRHGLNPQKYLSDLFVRLPSQSIQRLGDLLPDNWQPAKR